MLHKHHILPKYKGGSDSPENLIEVSVTQHAMFHYCNWQMWGDKRDWLAWKGLKGEIPKQELVRELRKLGASKGGSKAGEKTATKDRMRKLANLHREKAVKAAATFEANEKRKKSLAKIKHQQGSKNSQFGTMWVTDGKSNRKVKRETPLPEGFYPGRTLKSGT